MSSWLVGFLLALAPLAVLVILLVGGLYPGEASIERCRRAIFAWFQRLRGPVGTDRPLRLPVPVPDCGGRLVATSLAGRGPPASPGFP